MAKKEKTGNFFTTLFRSLSGKLDEVVEDEEGYDKEELAALNQMSNASTMKLEREHGEQHMYVDDDEEMDRLGHKKPAHTPVVGKEKSSSEKTFQREDDYEVDDDYTH